MVFGGSKPPTIDPLYSYSNGVPQGSVAADIPADEAETVEFVAPDKFMVDCVYVVAHVVLIVRQGFTFAGAMTA
ncbi:hypothetical protein T265_04539 [Opisthorchis viverrini]|uniref:Uncharacterized protein n=1 Tax=Opisthorchis viverrini TaxID=6198 RepID=A0A074ZNK7_OPIVI|nr:hypothetical protein T265_04539 [Opisthorchis viverrini]KER28666.1 hypothetical protein T265_04539 [Opisthorchis viverrini]